MPAVACLIADPERNPLDPRIVAEAARILDGEVRWLGEAQAAEITSDALDPDSARSHLATLIADAPVDQAVLPVAHRRKRLLLCDMDSTIITIECIDELADFAGIKTQIAAVTRRAMNGELDFASALRERVALLAGLPRGAIERVIAERLRAHARRHDAREDDAANGACTALVSGGFTAFTRHVQDRCGFDLQEANELEIVDGVLTGRLLGRAARGRGQAVPRCCGSGPSWAWRQRRRWLSATAPTICRC